MMFLIILISRHIRKVIYFLKRQEQKSIMTYLFTFDFQTNFCIVIDVFF